MRQHCCGKPYDLRFIIFRFFSISINGRKKTTDLLAVFYIPQKPVTLNLCIFKPLRCSKKLYQVAAAFFLPVSNSGGEPELSLITS